MAYKSKSYRKFLATGTTAAIVASAIAPAASAADHPFTDVNSNYADAVSYLYNNEITNGLTETTFGTYANLTRGDAAVIIARALGLDMDNAPDAGFEDVNNRVAGGVNALVEAGIMDGYSDTEFKPAEQLSRGAMAKILVNAFDLSSYAVDTEFTDLTATFGEYIEALYGADITNGKTETTFGTNLSITRGEFAVLLHKSVNFEAPVPEVVSVNAVADNKVVVNFNTAIKDVDHSNFSLNNDLAVVDAKLSSDKKSVELTTNQSFVDGVTYEVVATDIESVSGEKVEELKGSFKFELATFQAPTLSKTTFEKGENIKDFVVVKDSEGKVISADKYTVTGIESDVAGAVNTTTGEIGATLTESTASLVKVTVTMYTGQVIEGEKTTINVTIPVESAEAVTASFNNTPFENAVEAQHKYNDTKVKVGETDTLTVYTKDGKGNPEDDALALNSTDYKVTVNNDSLNIVSSVSIGSGNISVTGKAPGKANLTVTRLSDGVEYPVTFTVVEPNNNYKDLSLSATAATLVKGDGVNGSDVEESVDQKTIDIDWIDQDNNVTPIDFTAANTTPVSNAKSSLTVSNVATTGDKVIVSTQSEAVTLVPTADGIEVETKDGVSPQNALITVSYFDKDGKLVGQTKEININIAEAGNHAKYVVEQVGVLNAAYSVDHTVAFKTYSVDANGVKRDDVTAETTFSVKDGISKIADHWVADSFTSNVIGFDTSVTSTVADTLNNDGQFDITYKVSTADALGEATVQFTNSKAVQESVTVNTNPVAIKLDSTDATAGITIEDILFGKLNADEVRLDDELSKYFAVNIGQDGYKYNKPLVSVTNTLGAEMVSGSEVYGITQASAETNLVELGFEDTNALNVTAEIVNATNLDTTSGLKIASGKTSATFTIVLDAVTVNGDTRLGSSDQAVKEAANLLANPVSIDVTLTK